MLRTSISQKILLVVLIMTVLVMAIWNVVDYSAIKQRESGQDRRNVLLSGDRLATSLVYPLWNLNDIEVEKIIMYEMAQPYIHAIMLHQADGSLYIGKIKDAQDRVSAYTPNKQSELASQSAAGALTRDIINNGKSIGAVTVYPSDASLRELLRQQRRLIALKLLLLTVITTIALYMALKVVIIKPLALLTEWAATLSVDTPDPQPPISRHDEIGKLAAAFSKLTTNLFESLQQSKIAQAEVHTLNAELEQRVFERTQELEKANVALKQEIAIRTQAQEEISWLNDDLQQQKLALENVNRELETFSYSVSHDLRAPVRHIISFSQILCEDYGSALQPDAHALLTRIDGAARKMMKLIEGLLNLSKASRGELTFSRVNLSAMAVEITGQLQQDSPERQATFIIPDNIVAWADATLMRAVLENLIGNAWKYSAKKDATVIELGTANRKGKTVYFVRDNGAGFDMAHAEKLFVAFHRMHSADDFEGTGIGLATVHRIINRHKGELWAEAQVDAGATFSFVLGTEA
jgi:signal transduction histidine kinase